ncbi:MAG: cbb3-type cytochrome c oxidase subunit I [Saprospiraceae bacterium]|nr:cbb3-type cytochrome c oxidase subunit I [Saprospiraceae bacterium]
MGPKRTFLTYLMNPKNWWLPFFLILGISLAGVAFIGYETYDKAPPIPDFTDEKGHVVVSNAQILEGQRIFHHYALMEYGSMFGDGALRGPDFTAQALHEISVNMAQYHRQQMVAGPSDQEALLLQGLQERVKAEIKANRYNPENNRTTMSPAQVAAVVGLRGFYTKVFTQSDFPEAFKPAGYLTDPAEINALSDFFFWGAWVCSAERPGTGYSYTHNWPFDPQAGNTATPSTMLWSMLGLFGLILGLGFVLYYYGQFDQLSDQYYTKNSGEMVTVAKLLDFQPTPSQRATFKFFVTGILLFLIQVLAGVLTVHDFVGFTTIFGIDLQALIPITVSRSWHVLFSLLWISACWVGVSIFILPLLAKREIRGQVKLINLLYGIFLVIGLGSFVGLYMGPKNLLGTMSRWLGHQGWEFVELGRFYQYLLMGVFILWAVIVYRGVKPVLVRKNPWALPNWMLYSVVSIMVLLMSGFVATPKTNFVIADFWRWCVVHMWAEAFFEVFTTIIVGYLMVLMGLVNRDSVNKVVFLATLLFLGSGLLGISHNFYWNAKPVGTLAIGSIFSTLQVVPLVLLTLEAWRFQRMPATLNRSGNGNGKSSLFAMPAVFLFLVGVNFWNFFGAGVFGLIINLPIANYYEHGTYLTVNHGHAALMGVYGNLSIGALLFCCRYLGKPEHWNEKLVKNAFWSINVGLLLMVIMDLFPAGLHQLFAAMDKGLWFARSQAFIQSPAFQTMTWLRIVGGTLFTIGGVFPLTWFILKQTAYLKPSVLPLTPVAQKPVEEEVSVP